MMAEKTIVDLECASAATIAAAVESGAASAATVIDKALARIATLDPKVNAFTTVLEERARKKAAALDALHAKGERLGPLAGVPYAVKNLYDIEGVVTRAGATINEANAPAIADAFVIAQLEAAGAVLVGALNMDEYAYGFTGENIHDGPSLNPHDPRHMTGGSSGGSAAAVASGMVPFALGSDTNGSVRVPASLCGLFGLKPTYGRLSRRGVFPFVGSFDHVGLLARTTTDLALIYDAMQGRDERDSASALRDVERVAPRLGQGRGELRIAVAGDYFRRGGNPGSYAAVDAVARALSVTREGILPEAARARAAAYLITAAEGAAFHLARLRRQAADFDPAVRDRLFAGAMIPAAAVNKAQKFRAWFQGEVRKLFADVDVIITPATPCRAPLSGQKTMVLDGREVPVRAELGLYTQPISFIGLPALTVPVWTAGERLPIGVQLVAPAWHEDYILRVAQELEAMGVVSAPIAQL
jgi:aspartyl-tRNA(Asn)/glutamyl-tRNA(Gln) amidotransferase subunit A